MTEPDMHGALESQQASDVRRQLVDLVRRHGPDLLDDGRRVRAMLADAVPGAGPETNLVALAIGTGVPMRLREAGSDPARVAAAVEAATEELHRTSSVQAEDARWAVGVIAEALGMPTAAAGGASGRQTVPKGGELVVRAGGREHVATPGAVVTLGRDPSCTLSIDSPAVSRQHGQLVHGPGGWEYQDHGSTQGSFVNGVAVRTLRVDGATQVTLGQGREAVTVQLAPAGDAPARTPAPPQRPTPVATEIPGARPGGALLGGPAPATELAGDAAHDSLTVTLGGTSRTVRPGTTLSVGRESDNDLVASHSTVSRHHLRIEHVKGGWRLVDGGSTSGTWSAGERVSTVALRGRQEFRLGDKADGDKLLTDAGGASPAPRSTRHGAFLGRGGMSRRSKVLAAAGVALVLVVAAGGLVAWRLIDDDPPQQPAASTTTTPDEIARATVLLVNQAAGEQGSGVIIDAANGLILTNAHVAAPSAVGLGVFLMEFADEQTPDPKTLRVDISSGLDESAEPRFFADVVAVDGYLDVAVLKIDTKISGAPASKEDLDGLSEVPLGDSEDVKTSDEISFYGYPAASDSTAPSFTQGVVAGPIQDDRLDEFRSVINTTADISPGNSGGPAVDESGHVIGVATWEAFENGGGTAFSRIRPVNLAMPVIEAAKKGESYSSPWTVRGPSSADVVTWTYAAPSATGQVTEDCTFAGAGASPTTLALEYEGFPGREHTDVAAALYVSDGGSWSEVAVSTTAFPTTLPQKGCMTVTFDTDVPPGTYRLKVGIGGDLRVVVDQSVTLR